MTDAAGRRLSPLDPRDWDPALRDVLAGLGQPLNIHRVIARNPDLMRSYAALRDHVVRESSLDPRHRELLILRVADRTACAYEWDHHVVRGRDAGLADAEIARVREGGGAKGWTPAEALLLQAVDDMLAWKQIGGGTWQAMCGIFSDGELLDILFTIGIYSVMSTILKTARVPHEPGFAVDNPV